MAKSLHFHFFDAGSHDGETQRWTMCNHYSIRDGKVHIGQSQMVKAEEWPAYREYLERGGWTERKPTYGWLERA